LEWLSFDSALVFSRGIASPSQLVSIVANVGQLHKDIPVSPRTVVSSDGLSITTRCWYGRIGRRLLMIECEDHRDANGSDSVLIHTHYGEHQHSQGDWTVLREIEELPKSVQVTRALYVESRASNPNCVVYRPDSRGWDDAIYRANDVIEAAGLLAFLQRDLWNSLCFIGPPEPRGEWRILQEARESVRTVGTYPGKTAALRVAYKLSLQPSHPVLTVRDFSGSSSESFRISQGFVSQAAGPVSNTRGRAAGGSGAAQSPS
jgi:hypothetical protein